jgi:hypothetical protein
MIAFGHHSARLDGNSLLTPGYARDFADVFLRFGLAMLTCE